MSYNFDLYHVQAEDLYGHPLKYDISKLVQRSFKNIDFTIYSTDILYRMVNCHIYYLCLSDRDQKNLFDELLNREYF